jgi:hypothetical protein
MDIRVGSKVHLLFYTRFVQEWFEGTDITEDTIKNVCEQVGSHHLKLLEEDRFGDILDILFKFTTSGYAIRYSDYVVLTEEEYKLYKHIKEST